MAYQKNKTLPNPQLQRDATRQAGLAALSQRHVIRLSANMESDSIFAESVRAYRIEKNAGESLGGEWC